MLEGHQGARQNQLASDQHDYDVPPDLVQEGLEKGLDSPGWIKEVIERIDEQGSDGQLRDVMKMRDEMEYGTQLEQERAGLSQLERETIDTVKKARIEVLSGVIRKATEAIEQERASGLSPIATNGFNEERDIKADYQYSGMSSKSKEELDQNKRMYDKLKEMQANGEFTESGWHRAEKTCRTLFDKRTTDHETQERLNKLADEGLYQIHQMDRRKSEHAARASKAKVRPTDDEKPVTKAPPNYRRGEAPCVDDIKKINQAAWKKKVRDQGRSKQRVGIATSQPPVMGSPRLPRQEYPSVDQYTVRNNSYRSGGMRYQQGVHDLNETRMHCDEYEGRMYSAMRQRQEFTEAFQARGHGDKW